MPTHSQLATSFDLSNPARLNSKALNCIWARAYGDRYPQDIRPNAFYPREILSAAEKMIRLGPDGLLADLGCGHGGAGIHLVKQTGMRLYGIDVSPFSIKLATDRAAAAGLGDRAAFKAGDAANTGLTDESCVAVIGFDVLVFMPDKAAAIKEAARILRPGGGFAFTTWEEEGYSTRLGQLQVSDHRPLLEDAGFDIEAFDEPRDWREQQASVLHALVEQEAQLCSDIGKEAASFLANMARGAIKELPHRRYVFAISRRRGEGSNSHGPALS